MPALVILNAFDFLSFLLSVFDTVELEDCLERMYKYNYFPKLCAGGGETFTVDDDASHSQVLGNVLDVYR